MIDRLIDEQEQQGFHLKEALKFAKRKLRHLMKVRDTDLNQPTVKIVPRS